MNTPFEGSHRVPAIVRWPGKVPAGVVTQEMLAAVDWLPTLAGIAGAPNLVPQDRPVDGVDASAFMLGKSEKTGRDFSNSSPQMSLNNDSANWSAPNAQALQGLTVAVGLKKFQLCVGPRHLSRVDLFKAKIARARFLYRAVAHAYAPD